jgi:hypothetical protein
LSILRKNNDEEERKIKRCLLILTLSNTKTICEMSLIVSKQFAFFIPITIVDQYKKENFFGEK